MSQMDANDLWVAAGSQEYHRMAKMAQDKDEEVRLWKDRYASLFAWAVVASQSENPDKHKMNASQREIFHRWYGEVTDG